MGIRVRGLPKIITDSRSHFNYLQLVVERVASLRGTGSGHVAV